MAASAEKDIVTKLTESVEKMTNNNASSTTQRSDSMKIHLDMAKNTNLIATQGKEPKGKILVDNANRNAVFQWKLDPKGYCWTHGCRVTTRHSS